MTRSVACIKARRYSNRYNTFWYVREVKPGEFEPWAHGLDNGLTVNSYCCGKEI